MGCFLYVIMGLDSCSPKCLGVKRVVMETRSKFWVFGGYYVAVLMWCLSNIFRSFKSVLNDLD